VAERPPDRLTAHLDRRADSRLVPAFGAWKKQRPAEEVFRLFRKMPADAGARNASDLNIGRQLAAQPLEVSNREINE
jgi:hypothetical protein